MSSEYMEGKRPERSDEVMDFLEYWRVIRKRWKMILGLISVIVVSTAAYSLSMNEIYEAQAIIAPVDSMQGPGGALSALSQQFGGIASLAGISTPAEARLNEIKNYLDSKILREKVITEHNLLPIIFSDRWDQEKKEWKKPRPTGLIFKRISNSLNTLKSTVIPGRKSPAESDGPTLWDGLRAFDKGFIKVRVNKKENTLTISARTDDPNTAVQVVSDFIVTLTDHMSGETRRVAETNRKYLEEQLTKAVDPITRQKIYALLSQQVETALMSRVKENYAFKVIDPPRAPDQRVSPKRTVMVVLSFFLSLFIGVFLAFFLEFIEKNRARSPAGGGTQQG